MLGAGGAAVIGAQAMRLQNANGVVLELTGNKVGLEFALDLSGMAISLAPIKPAILAPHFTINRSHRSAV